MGNNHFTLGTVEASEKLIYDLYIDLRRKINQWAAVTMQTAQARMGYVGQHLVSVVTGYPGGRSGARGKDLIISKDKYGEIKTCYRVDQLGKCNACDVPVASIEEKCPNCGSEDIKRNDDSKWLIGIRHDEEFQNIIDPETYYLVLFDFEDLANPETIRASIWTVDPKVPGFAYCMVDYYLNIRKHSKSKAPFNLWPYQLKFYLMRPTLIYRSLIHSDDTIDTLIFPGEDAPAIEALPPLSEFSQSRNLTKEKAEDLARNYGLDIRRCRSKKDVLLLVENEIQRDMGSPHDFVDTVAHVLYWPEIKAHVENGLPGNLGKQFPYPRLN